MDACPNCNRRYEGGKVLVSYRRCPCPGGSVGGGHTVKLCCRCGWQAWPGCEVAPGEFQELGSLKVED